MEVKDILQINATIIAGAFIFLSLSIGLFSESETELEDREQEQERLNQTNANANATKQPMSEPTIRINSQAFVAFLISAPFAMSSFMAVAAELDKDNPKTDYKRTVRASLLLMFAGFFVFFIVAMVVFFGLIRFIAD